MFTIIVVIYCFQLFYWDCFISVDLVKDKISSWQVIAVARTADLVIMMVDATKAANQKDLLTAELESVGIRLNKNKPGIYFKVRFLPREIWPIHCISDSSFKFMKIVVHNLHCSSHGNWKRMHHFFYVYDNPFSLIFFLPKQQKKAGGLKFNATCALTRIDEKMVQMILHEYKIFNAEVWWGIHDIFYSGVD